MSVASYNIDVMKRENEIASTIDDGALPGEGLSGRGRGLSDLKPFGQVPAFEDGDLKLFESRAITKYIAHEYAEKGTQLIVTNDSKKMAIITVWLEVEAQQYDQAASKLLWELHFKPLFGIPTDPKVVEENESKLSSVLGIYEKRLSETKYLAGECFSFSPLNPISTT
ncbi:glutathione S-transferase-like isoform X2 [Arachis stenosperma]|uniref:glutathione S-transferase-like isoform X2 n=1 Tax=Arachis stenosperma TaxID=217475 RepID=UPI0025AD8AF3|nr:glutathione S-transferase-like isoform X2 [Arachis stenosperma]